MNLEFQFDMFLQSLARYAAAPTPMLSLELQHRMMSLKAALRQQQTETEQRVTERVLQRLSVRLQDDCVIAEIDSLREAIERLGK